MNWKIRKYFFVASCGLWLGYLFYRQYTKLIFESNKVYYSQKLDVCIDDK
jgi:hypothetical protein